MGNLKMTWHRGDQCAVLAGPSDQPPIAVWRAEECSWKYSIGGNVWLLFNCHSLETAMARALNEARSHYARARNALAELG